MKMSTREDIEMMMQMIQNFMNDEHFDEWCEIKDNEEGPWADYSDLWYQIEPGIDIDQERFYAKIQEVRDGFREDYPDFIMEYLYMNDDIKRFNDYLGFAFMNDLDETKYETWIRYWMDKHKLSREELFKKWDEYNLPVCSIGAVDETE